MKAEVLKKSILQMAIQGKLVPQNCSDEPASVLLQKIRTEKEKLIKEGKIKRDKETSSITEPEIPFDIPETWEWVRLSQIWLILNGDRGKNYPSKSTLSSSGIPFISAVNLDGKTVIKDEKLLCLSQSQYDKLGNGKLQKNDIVVCIRGSLGKHGVYPFEKGAIASSLVILRNYFKNLCYDKYLLLYLDSPLLSLEIKKYDNGTAQPNLAAKSLEQFLIPIPPLEEQKRIVEAIEKFEPLLAEYDKLEQQAEKLDGEIFDKLKKSILQYAIQGKLVLQDSLDEPASVLLSKIKAEKEKLIKEGKIKKEKPLSPITETEKPFDIPDSWQWVRLREVVYNRGQITPKNKFAYIDIGSINNVQQKLNDVENIIDAHEAPSRARKIVQLGDVLYSTVRPYLHNMCVVDKEFSFMPIASTGFAVLTCLD